ncbi:MAG: DUF4143 domain-containing protein [archaeon]|nr:DUF4143 domain-containing protein [archaeon]
MALTPPGYLPRLIDTIIEQHLKSFGAVSIEGPKWCGKTWAARNQCKSEFQLTSNNLALLKIDVRYAFEGETPRLIDEWQDHPTLWEDVRFEVDRSPEKGRFVLCGSSTIDPKKKKHTGAGRIGSIPMYTMSLYETGDSDGKVSLKELFDNPAISTDTEEITLDRLIDLVHRGGWPGLLDGNADPTLVLRDYINKLCEEDSFRIDGKTRDPHKFRMLLRSLARNESTVVSDAALRRDIVESDNEDLGDSTVDDYKSVLERLNILWYQPAFSTNLRSSARVGKTSKKHLADPSLAMCLLGLDRQGAINDLNTFGFLFESLCEHDLQVYCKCNGYELFHYRDGYGNEFDAVVERPDKSWGAIEIKLGFNQVEEAAAKMIKLAEKFSRPPAFLCVICGTAPVAYRRPDGVYVVPITRLGP